MKLLMRQNKSIHVIDSYVKNMDRWLTTKEKNFLKCGVKLDRNGREYKRAQLYVHKTTKTSKSNKRTKRKRAEDKEYVEKVKKQDYKDHSLRRSWRGQKIREDEKKGNVIRIKVGEGSDESEERIVLYDN